jgi:hypothetical protein
VTAAGEDDGCSFRHRRPASRLGTRPQEVAPVDDGGSQGRGMVEPGASGRPPGGAGFAHVEDRGRFPESLKAEHRHLGGAGPVDLRLEFAGVNLRAVGAGEKAAYLVGCAVDLRAALGGSAVEEIDEPPSELLGVVLQGSVGEQGEQIGPDGAESLADGVGIRQLRGCIAGDPLNLQVPELKLAELRGKCCVHVRLHRFRRRRFRRQEPEDPSRPPLRTVREAAGNPRPRLARAAACNAATRAESRRVAARRRRVRALFRAEPAFWTRHGMPTFSPSRGATGASQHWSRRQAMAKEPIPIQRVKDVSAACRRCMVRPTRRILARRRREP